MEYQDRGKFRANPNATEENTLRLPDPDNPGTPATDSASDINTVTGSPSNFTGIVYQGRDDASGVTHIFPTPVAITDYDGLRDAINKVIGKQEVNPTITVSFSTPNVTVTHYGAGTLSDVLIDGATDGATWSRS